MITTFVLLYCLLHTLSLINFAPGTFAHTLISSNIKSNFPRNSSIDSLDSASPRARTSQGIVQGVHLNDEVNAFLAVPYAEPPVGTLRFHIPVPLPTVNESITGVLDASEFGPVCWQFHYTSVLLDNIIETTPQSEDCLTLNIFIPRRARFSGALPTLLWIYGGSFSEGGGSMPVYDPRNLVASQPDMIVVTINYRMNIFGFPNSPALPIDHQNLGIRDIRAALEWVHENIAAFGGDPEAITLGGESAGADAVAAIAFSYRENPIARALLLESGQPLAALGYADPTEEYYRVARTVGCRNADHSAAELKCMKTIPAAELRHAVSNRTITPFGYPNGGSPMIDNVTLFTPEEYLRRGEAGEFARLPVMIGMNNREGDGVVNWSPKHGVNKTFSDIFTTSFFECPISLEASYRTKYEVPVWRYRYFGTFPADTFWCWLGSYHVSEVPMLLGSYKDLKPSRPLNADEVASAEFFQHAVSTFVQDPENGLSEKLGWPVYDPNGPTLVELFHDNTPTYRLEDPRKYNRVCDDPPGIPYEQWANPPPDQVAACRGNATTGT